MSLIENSEITTNGGKGLSLALIPLLFISIVDFEIQNILRFYIIGIFIAVVLQGLRFFKSKNFTYGYVSIFIFAMVNLQMLVFGSLQSIKDGLLDIFFVGVLWFFVEFFATNKYTPDVIFKSYIKYIRWSFVVSMFAALIFSLNGLFMIEELGRTRFFGVSGPATSAIFWVAVVIPLGVSFLEFRRGLDGFLFAIGVTAIFATQSRMAILSLYFSLFLVLYFHLSHSLRKIILIFYIAFPVTFASYLIFETQILFAGESLSVEGLNFNGREYIWDLLIEDVLKSPWLGYGFGAVESLLRDVAYSESFMQPHNDYLKLIFNFGVIGVIAFFAILFSCFWALKVSFGLKEMKRLNTVAACYFLSFIVLMTTDNILIYMFFVYPLSFIFGYVISNKNQFGR